MSKINKTKREHKTREVRQRIDTTPTVRRLITLVILSIILTLVVEGFSRMNVVKLFKYMTNRPLYYLYNNLIILTVLSFSELFRHRRAMLSLLAALTAILGIAGGIIVKERIQPLTTMDILMLGEAIKLTTIYFSWGQIIAACVFIFAVVVGLLYLITRLPKRRRVNYFRALSVFAGLLIACVCICMVGVNQGKFPRVYDNLVDAYENYGFTTCFAFTFGDKGMKQPSDYSSDTVTTVVEEIDGTDQVAVKPVFDEDDNLSRPNVIFVQLESFIDTDTIIGAEFDRDPTPNYHQLAKEWPYGELYVPSVGGGTVNVEFEVLTGMNIDYFGANEYPYSTQLADKTCESIAYALSEEGYRSTSLHNYTATFYGRNKVYGNLGFDRFVSLEYMPYVTYSKVGWAEDVVLADEIMKALSATEERDFVFAVTVESHGKYEDAYEYREGDVQIEALPEQITIGPMANYLQIIGETDEFIGLLLEKLSTFDEPTICVFYGDHLPALDFTADILTTENLYASHYIVWNNFGKEIEAPNLQAYRLSANLLRQMGIGGGIISRYHQSYPLDVDDEAYFNRLEILEYDMLFGDHSAYNGEMPYEPTDLQFGSQPIEITSASQAYGRLLVTGKNFTEYSKIIVDGTAVDTAFVTDRQIIAIVPRTPAVAQVEVAQIANDGTELSRTAVYEMDQ